MKEVTNSYMAINVYTCPVRMQMYENKTLRMLDETINDERWEMPFSNCDVKPCSFL
jgi:hypothetical protein